ncbi:MAG: hypothetical protein Q4B67_05945 [Eubacteriales bacterium]|nr:hypothetical protein [Eubacteriales bacterium]
MGKRKESLADNYYDRLCNDYMLRYVDPGEFKELRLSSYRIEGKGRVCLIRLGGTEIGTFAPFYKEAPFFCFMMKKGLFSKSLSFEIIRSATDKRIYRRFNELEGAYSVLPEADTDDFWYSDRLADGSCTKKGESDKKSFVEMADDYFEAYVKLLEFSLDKDNAACTADMKSLCEGCLENGGLVANVLIKKLGPEKARELFERYIFAN